MAAPTTREGKGKLRNNGEMSWRRREQREEGERAARERREPAAACCTEHGQ
jgi:hypothetical protein